MTLPWTGRMARGVCARTCRVWVVGCGAYTAHGVCRVWGVHSAWCVQGGGRTQCVVCAGCGAYAVRGVCRVWGVFSARGVCRVWGVFSAWCVQGVGRIQRVVCAGCGAYAVRGVCAGCGAYTVRVVCAGCGAYSVRGVCRVWGVYSAWVWGVFSACGVCRVRCGSCEAALTALLASGAAGLLAVCWQMPGQVQMYTHSPPVKLPERLITDQPFDKADQPCGPRGAALWPQRCSLVAPEAQLPKATHPGARPNLNQTAASMGLPWGFHGAPARFPIPATPILSATPSLQPFNTSSFKRPEAHKSVQRSPSVSACQLPTPFFSATPSF
eukprot:365395-Chlamydomonas_euryale.AAC.3